MGKLTFVLVLLPLLMRADTIKLKNGQSMSGIIRTIDGGKVTIEVSGAKRVIEILQVEQIDFDTAHTADADIPVREFTRIAEQLNRAEKETKRALDQIKAQWSTRRSVAPNQAQQWTADRERFAGPLTDYRKAIRQMYLDLATHVDRYNAIAKDATKFYVGVKGLLNVGAPLIQDSERERPLKEFIPAYWYDQIYYDAYRKGFHDAVEFQALTPR